MECKDCFDLTSIGATDAITEKHSNLMKDEGCYWLACRSCMAINTGFTPHKAK